MKLTCDLCGGVLQMNLDGQGAVCGNCGMTYSLEHLRKKLGSQSVEKQESKIELEEEIPEVEWEQVEPAPTRQLYIKRRVDLLMLSKVAVILDGQQVGILAGQGKTSAIPVSQGLHKITFRAVDGSGITDMDEMTFRVGDYDWYGEFWLRRGAFKAEYQFEMRECI